MSPLLWFTVHQGSVLEWLQCLGLDVYYETLAHQQYETLESVVELSWEDLEDIGINRLGKNIQHASDTQCQVLINTCRCRR